MGSPSDEFLSVKWLSRGLGRIAWADYGQDQVAYHRDSGNTHFLNASSKNLIIEILCEPKSVVEVANAFGLAEDDIDWPSKLTEVHSTLEQLEQLGFVEQL